jgi:hypothetical protein
MHALPSREKNPALNMLLALSPVMVGVMVSYTENCGIEKYALPLVFLS